MSGSGPLASTAEVCDKAGHAYPITLGRHPAWQMGFRNFASGSLIKLDLYDGRIYQEHVHSAYI
jgi:hypothetical protein